MSSVRCTYCGRYYLKKTHGDKCAECALDFKRVFDKVSQRYAPALKGLSEK